MCVALDACRAQVIFLVFQYMDKMKNNKMEG